MRPYRPIFLGDDLYCCQSVCHTVLDAGADFVFVCKPNSHKRLYELLHDQFIPSTGWLKTRNRKKQVERHRFRWMNGVAVRDSDDAVDGSAIERKGKRTYTNRSSPASPPTVAAIARAGRARWKIENEGNCLARHGYNLKRNFGHGSDGLANLLATLNPSPSRCMRSWTAFALWRQCRGRTGNRETALTEYLLPALDGLVREMLKQRPPCRKAVSESPSPGRRPKPTQAAVRFEGRLAAPSAGRPPRASAQRLYTVASGTVRTSIQAPKSLRRSQLHLPDLPK